MIHRLEIFRGRAPLPVLMAALVVCVGIAATTPQQPEPVEGAEVLMVPPEGGWDDMALRGLVCRALIHTVHRADAADLLVIAHNVVRARTEGLTMLEQRALSALLSPLGVDVAELLDMGETEARLWACAADPTLPVPTRTSVFGRGLQVNGLGREQWIEPVADWPDSWDAHRDHPRHPLNWDPWVVESIREEPEGWPAWVVDAVGQEGE